jgi:hypothetical protein
VSNCCLIPNEKIFSYISLWEQVTFEEMIMRFNHYTTNAVTGTRTHDLPHEHANHYTTNAVTGTRTHDLPHEHANHYTTNAVTGTRTHDPPHEHANHYTTNAVIGTWTHDLPHEHANHYTTNAVVIFLSFLWNMINIWYHDISNIIFLCMEDRHYENKCYVLLSIGMVGKWK